MQGLLCDEFADWHIGIVPCEDIDFDCDYDKAFHVFSNQVLVPRQVARACGISCRLAMVAIGSH